MKTRLLLLTILLTIFTGCSPTYNITPAYDKTNKSLTIDEYLIPNVTFKKTKQNSHSSNSNTSYTTFKIDNEVCKRVSYRTYNVGVGRYYYSSALEDVLNQYSDECVIEKIGNVNFFRCYNKTKVSTSTDNYDQVNIHYGATASLRNEYGYAEKTTLYLGTYNKCFNAIKNHFEVKTDSKYIETIDMSKK